MVWEVTTDSRFASRCSLVFFESKKKKVKNVKKTLSGEQSFLSGMAFSVRVACHSRSWLNELSLKCHLFLRPPPPPPTGGKAKETTSLVFQGHPTTILGKYLFGRRFACLPLLGFPTSKKWYNCPFLTDFLLFKGHLEFLGAFLLAEIFEKITFDPYNFRITRLSARKSEQMKHF